ncbi:MAG: hypothetical protein J0J10_20120 [Bosea sp.]|uniref:hypothetical protein n=1 Tax=Bosea sp. (in: a-proteobacteria) TaxID=1871050 RepID=UPI001AC1D242|nr:hypothetical protein [Bosea sp. (in: a-proteobacteria)]MBN9471079.1 hypothetical protein [Bosea sp. (in: a-proteobacteria)]
MTIGFRQFVESHDTEDCRPFLMQKFEGVRFAAHLDDVWNVAVNSYDFADMRDRLSLEQANSLRKAAFAINDGGGLSLPGDDFAVVFSMHSRRFVTLINRGFGPAIDTAGFKSPYVAKVFVFDPLVKTFEWLGECGLGSFRTVREINPVEFKEGDHLNRYSDTERILKGAGNWLDVFVMLLHLRAEDQITTWKMLPPSNAHKAMNYRRKQAGEDEVPTTRVVYVSPEPLNEWIGVQSRVGSKGTHASPIPHDRRGYYQRPKGGTEKSVWVRASKVRGGAKEPVSYEVRLRGAPLTAHR